MGAGLLFMGAGLLSVGTGLLSVGTGLSFVGSGPCLHAVYISHRWGLMFMGVGAWLLFVSMLGPWCVSCHMSYGHH